MFIHLFVNRLKIIIRDKELIFWTLIFPLVLGTFFNMAFSNLNSQQFFQEIDIAIVETEEYKNDTTFENVLKTVSEGEDRLFNLNKSENEDKAKEMLENDEIKGYIIDGKLVVKEEGMYQTIIKTFLDEYNQKSSMIMEILQYNNYQISTETIEGLFENTTYIKNTTYSRESPDIVVNYFYTLIAMTCLYFGYWTVKETVDIQANQSTRAVRMNIVPVNKIKILLCNMCATLFVSSIIILIVLLYVTVVLNVDFGTRVGLVLVACFVGIITGCSIGTLIGVGTKKGLGMKIGILLAYSMIGSFLAGMMMETMKYYVQEYAPILSYINPANLITDAFYSLYYYETLDRFLLNISILLVISVIATTLSYIILRRQKYESI